MHNIHTCIYTPQYVQHQIACSSLRDVCVMQVFEFSLKQLTSRKVDQLKESLTQEFQLIVRPCKSFHFKMLFYKSFQNAILEKAFIPSSRAQQTQATTPPKMFLIADLTHFSCHRSHAFVRLWLEHIPTRVYRAVHD
jgi:hypothetical protein